MTWAIIVSAFQESSPKDLWLNKLGGLVFILAPRLLVSVRT
jgi:hypothetical protein